LSFEYKANREVLEALRKLPKPLSDSYSYEYLDLLMHMNIVLGFMKSCELPENFFDHHVFDIIKRTDSLTEAARKLDEMGYTKESRYIGRHVSQLYEDFKNKFRESFSRCVCKKH